MPVIPGAPAGLVVVLTVVLVTVCPAAFVVVRTLTIVLILFPSLLRLLEADAALEEALPMTEEIEELSELNAEVTDAWAADADDPAAEV